MLERASSHYESRYFEWQMSIGQYYAWLDLIKFIDYITIDSVVLDFGCGGGFLLKNVECAERIGVEINPSAMEIAEKNGIEVYSSLEEVPNGYVDVVISNHALEHTLHPLVELKSLRRKLKPGGKIIFVVPCESLAFAYSPDDINHHLYSWSPMCLGNLFTEAGFSVIESKPYVPRYVQRYVPKWPPKYRLLAQLGGRRLFNLVCRIYGKTKRSWFQVRIVAEKEDT